MIGYGEIVLEAAQRPSARVAEWRGVSTPSDQPGLRAVARAGKLVRNVERFALTPLTMAGRRARVAHVIDPGNAIYLDVVRHDRAVVTVHEMIPYLAAVDRLEGFRAETGVPMNLNTSFNENEPVVCRPQEAIDCFLRTKMDVLVLGDRVVRRS